MDTSLRARLFRVRYPYTNPVDQQRARGLLLISWAVFFANIPWVLMTIVPALIQLKAPQPLDVLWVVMSSIAHFVILGLIQRGAINTAAWIFVLTITAITNIGINESFFNAANIIILTIPLVLAGILLKWQGLAIVSVITFGNVIRLALVQSQQFVPITTIPAENVAFPLMIILVTLGLLTLFLLIFSTAIQRIANYTQTDVAHLHTVSRFGRDTVNNEIDYIVKALDLIQNDFNYSFAQVFLFDEVSAPTQAIRLGLGTDRAVVTTENIRAGIAILESASTRVPIAVQNNDTPERRLHLLPSTRAAIALPIVAYDRLIGVLDVQSSRDTNISEIEQRGLAAMAIRLAEVISHFRRISQLQNDVKIQSEAINRLRSRVAALTETSQQSIREDWRTFISNRGKEVLGYDLVSTESVTIARDIPEHLLETLQSGQIHVEDKGNEQILRIPIVFQEQILGAMSFTIPGDQKLHERQIELAQNVANRLALALENRRLFEQSQSQAQRETKASEIASELIGSTNIDTVMQTAAHTFQQALGAIFTQIYIEPGTFANVPHNQPSDQPDQPEKETA